MFVSIPAEMNRLIGSYLDLDSRVEFFKVLPENDDKFVKKLDSDKHNRLVMARLISGKITKITKCVNLQRRAVLCSRLMCYLSKTKNTWFLKHQTLVETIYAKACELSQDNSGGNVNLVLWKHQKSLYTVSYTHLTLPTKA